MKNINAYVVDVEITIDGHITLETYLVSNVTRLEAALAALRYATTMFDEEDWEEISNAWGIYEFQDCTASVYEVKPVQDEHLELLREYITEVDSYYYL